MQKCLQSISIDKQLPIIHTKALLINYSICDIKKKKKFSVTLWFVHLVHLCHLKYDEKLRDNFWRIFVNKKKLIN